MPRVSRSLRFSPRVRVIGRDRVNARIRINPMDMVILMNMVNIRVIVDCIPYPYSNHNSNPYSNIILTITTISLSLTTPNNSFLIFTQNLTQTSNLNHKPDPNRIINLNLTLTQTLILTSIPNLLYLIWDMQVDCIVHYLTLFFLEVW